MTLKQYRWIKLAFTVALAIVFSQGIIFKNYIIPISALMISSLILIYLRSKVKEIIADERDIATAGKSALLAIQIYTWLAVIAMIILYAMRDLNPSYEPIAITLALSACVLMFLYAVIFRYYHKVSLSDKKTIYTIIAIILFLILMLACLRFLSGEDDWICQNGKRIQHGHPSFPAPVAQCK